MLTLQEGTRDGYVETALGRVHYVSAGSGSPLVLIHGGFGSWAHWRENLAALAREHTVFAIDMPGFGLSCDATPGSSIEQLALTVRDAIAAMRETLPEPLRQQPAAIAAFSFGTAVAVRLALLDPQAVRALLLINPPGLGQVSEQVKAIQARAADAARTQGLRAGLEVTLRELMVHRPALATPAALDLLEDCVTHTRFVSRSLSRSVHLRPMISELRMPVHVVLGEEDPHQKHELHERLAWLRQTLGSANVSLFAATAHWLQYEQAERFNALALRCFRDDAGAPTGVAHADGQAV
ncbi:MAG: alpha/beta fold hydrolase [Noviherbaspirillum sp.]